MATSTTAPAAPRAASRFFRPELDILRLLAFSLVYLDHLLPHANEGIFYFVREGGAFGVPVFFSLSAYLITELLYREKDSTGHISLRSFYLRRILRIWPLYFLALFLAFGLSRIIPGTTPVSIGILCANLFLVGNWPVVFDLKTALPLGFSVLWSLGIEEQFYLLWPSFARRTSRRGLLFICAGIWLVSQFVTAYLAFHATPYNAAWFNTLVQMQYFAIGSAVSLALHGRIPAIRPVLRCGLVLSGLALFCIFHRTEDSTTYIPYLAAGLGTACILFGFLGMSLAPWATRLQYFGKISYGLYVYHFAVLVLAMYLTVDALHLHHGLLAGKFLLGIPLTLLIAHLSYKYFETPFLHLKERFEVVKSRAA